jgi:hypothetical protein
MAIINGYNENIIRKNPDNHQKNDSGRYQARNGAYFQMF